MIVLDADTYGIGNPVPQALRHQAHVRYIVLDRKPHPPNDSRLFRETKISGKTELSALWTGQSTQKRGLCGNLHAQLGLRSIIN